MTGVFSKEYIPQGTRFGPLKGDVYTKDNVPKMADRKYFWRVRTQAHALTQTWTGTHTLTQTHFHVYSHTRTHARAHTHTETHVYSHTCTNT